MIICNDIPGIYLQVFDWEYLFLYPPTEKLNKHLVDLIYKFSVFHKLLLSDNFLSQQVTITSFSYNVHFILKINSCDKEGIKQSFKCRVCLNKKIL